MGGGQVAPEISGSNVTGHDSMGCYAKKFLAVHEQYNAKQSRHLNRLFIRG